MDCYTAMINNLSLNEFEFVENDKAYDHLKECCDSADDMVSFTDENYEHWALRLTSEHGWEVEANDLKDARDLWLKDQIQ